MVFRWNQNQKSVGPHRSGFLLFSSLLHLQTNQTRRPGRQVGENKRTPRIEDRETVIRYQQRLFLLGCSGFSSLCRRETQKQKTFDTKRQDVNLNPLIIPPLHALNILRRDFKKFPKVIAYYFTEAIRYILTLGLSLLE